MTPPARVVLIDGRSGAGKSTLAGMLSADCRDAAVQVVALDMIYPGWDGLDAGVDIARDRILVPLRRGVDAVWHRWDWDRQRPAEAHVVDANRPLIVEGAGALTPATADLADVTVWVESPEESRRERALGRDGDAYRPYWQQWARQEERHVQRDDPAAIADIVVHVP